MWYSVCAALGLVTLKYRRDFRKVKWNHKIMCMNDKRFPFELLSNESDEVKSKGRPRKCWLNQVNVLMKELNLQSKVWNVVEFSHGY